MDVRSTNSSYLDSHIRSAAVSASSVELTIRERLAGGNAPMPLKRSEQPTSGVADILELSPSAQELGLPRDTIGKAVHAEGEEPLKEAFQDFVGQTFFAELIKSLRSSQKGAAYFNGGRAEEIFQGQLDQVLTEHMSDASAKTISDPMYELFQLGRSNNSTQ